MNKITTRDTVILTANFALFIFSIIISAFVAPISALYFFFWFLITSLGYLFARESFNRFETGVFLLVAYGYVVVETLLKILFYNDSVENGYTWLNMVEHVIFSFSLGIILYSFLKNDLQKISAFFVKIGLVLGVVGIFGVGNEIFEAIVRKLAELEDVAYYWDTVYDLGSNLAGGFVASIFLLILSAVGYKKGREVPPPVESQNELKSNEGEDVVG